jgi:hypothetical protein
MSERRNRPGNLWVTATLFVGIALAVYVLAYLWMVSPQPPFAMSGVGPWSIPAYYGQLPTKPATDGSAARRQEWLVVFFSPVHSLDTFIRRDKWFIDGDDLLDEDEVP